MKRKEILSFIFIFSAAIISVLGMLLFENMAQEPEGVAEAVAAFAVFSLCAVLISFWKAKLPVFLITFASAAALAVLSEGSGFLFSGLLTLLLFFRFSDETEGNKALAVTALAGNVLCLIPLWFRYADNTDTPAHLIREFREDAAAGYSTFRILLLLVVPLFICCAVSSLIRSGKKKSSVVRVLLFWAAALITAGATIWYCVLFSGEHIAAFLLFAWLFLLVLVREDLLFFGRRTSKVSI